MALLTYEYNNCINMQSQRILIYNILLKESYLRHLSSFEGHSSNENKSFLPPGKGGKLSSESNVTISLIIPLFQTLKQYLSANPLDTSMIKSMKKFMLAKMKTRYSSQQTQFLTTCTLLDIRYKSSTYLSNGFDQLEKDVIEILEDEEQSQHVIPATQGQELHNLSSFEANSSNDNKSIFDFEDDVVVDSQNIEIDTLKNEIIYYKRLTMSKDDKVKCNVLQWWKENKT